MDYWIGSNYSLSQLCGRLENEDLIALDTEFIRTDTFFPKLALIQISDGSAHWLIDVLSITEYDALRSLLESPKRTVILHACGEDIEVLDHSLGISPPNIFDTQIAAVLANIGFSMGYANLLETLTDIKIDKKETRSDWLARPLSKRQLKYAENDVIHLHDLYKILTQKLEGLSREEWLADEVKDLVTAVHQRKDSGLYYLRIKGGQRLGDMGLKCLERLCKWREIRARQLDRPRGRIIEDSVLLELANKMPKDGDALSAIEGLKTREKKIYGDELVSEISQVSADQSVPWIPKPITRASIELMKNIRTALIELADSQALPAECLVTKKELETILRSLEANDLEWPSRINRGWRKEIVKPEIFRLISGVAACDSHIF